MLLEYYIQYIKVNRHLSASTVKHYINGLNTINTLLSKYNFPTKNVFSVIDADELKSVKQFTLSNEEFLLKDAVGHNMYSAAFNHFYKFACEDEQFYKTELHKMDIIVPKPNQESITHASWKRNQIIIMQTIDAAHYCCEQNSTHTTFTSATTGNPYMEGHHLIPMQYQAYFENSIDVYANIICLCPICHRLLHYGTTPEKSYVLEKIYDERCKRLLNSGIDIYKNDFIRLVTYNSPINLNK